MASGMKWGDPIMMNENSYMLRNPNDYIDGFSTWKRCYAEFGSQTEHAESWRSCLFERMYLVW